MVQLQQRKECLLLVEPHITPEQFAQIYAEDIDSPFTSQIATAIANAIREQCNTLAQSVEEECVEGEEDDNAMGDLRVVIKVHKIHTCPYTEVGLAYRGYVPQGSIRMAPLLVPNNPRRLHPYHVCRSRDRRRVYTNNCTCYSRTSLPCETKLRRCHWCTRVTGKTA